MSISNDNYDRNFRRERDSRTKINNLVFTSSNHGNKIHCRTCIEHWVMILKEIDGAKKWWCHGCNQTIPYEKENVESSNKKYTSKFGTASGQSHSFIISKGKKKHRPRALSDDDKSNLAAAFGSSGEGATKVSEESHTYDSQGGWS